jgi:methyl-accepting chemotaxis protein
MFLKMEVGVRPAIGFVLVTLAMVVVAAIGLKSMHEAFENGQKLTVSSTKSATLAGAQNALWAMRWEEAQYLALSDPDAKQQIVNRSAQLRTQVDAALARAEKSPASDPSREESALAGKVSAAVVRHGEARQKWFDLLSNGKVEEAVVLRAEVLNPAGAQAVDDLAKLIRLQEADIQSFERVSAAALSQDRIILVSICLITTLLVGWLSWVNAKASRLRLRKAVSSLESVAAGNLTRDDQAAGVADGGRLSAAIESMRQNLRQLVGEVVSVSHALADTSAQIAQGNLDLSQRTEEQASTLEETASSMEELTATVAQNADNARQANRLAVGASDVARKGGEVVGQVVNTMTSISESSKKIVEIIGVIDGIAFQTNILALNAAVEAARAGEQGRGFAVVAAEVRSLAQRSAEAAKEIKRLISSSAEKVETGTLQVGAAGKTMQEIVSSVKKVTDLIAEIAAASQEQSSGIQQVNTAVSQMDQVLQQNAALVEEASAATESMKDQALGLLKTVSRFKLSADGHNPVFKPLLSDAKGSPARPPSALTKSDRRTAQFGGGTPFTALSMLQTRRAEDKGEWKEF